MPLSARRAVGVALVLLVSAPSPAATAEVCRVSTREQLAAALEKAGPGTTVLLAPGSYRGGIAQANLKGSRERPIVVKSENPKQPATIEGGASGLHLSAPAFVELRDLVFRGADANGINIDDGRAKDSPAHHITLMNLVVQNESPRGNRDGIKLSGLDDFRVENCTVEKWGTSGSGIDMVGCHNGVVTGSTFRHSGADFANGVQIKGGSSQIEVRHCRFDNAGGRGVNVGGSTGLAYFRPKPQGYEAKDVTVEDCTFTGSSAPVAFVGVDGAAVRYNTIYRPTRWVVRILQENQEKDFVPCRRGEFANNLIAFRSDEVRTAVNVGPGTAPETFTFSENHWVCLDRPQSTNDLVRLPVREKDGQYGGDPGFEAPEKGNFTRADAKRAKSGARPADESR